jgi:hypothetical protein
MLSKPIIVCAAMLYEDGTIVVGPRHFDMTMVRQLDRYDMTGINQVPKQGFIDQHGVYYNRFDAYKIAKANNQIKNDSLGPELYSEDLY